MSLTYEEVARILAVVDAAEGQDLDFSVGGRRITLGAWAEVQERHSKAEDPTRQHVQNGHTEGAAAVSYCADPVYVDVRAAALGYFHAKSSLRVGARINKGEELGYLVTVGPNPDTPVLANTTGTLVDLHVRDRDFVEYGQPVVTLQTSGGGP